ncbi:hypothetical protein F4810DRAFT_518844 [Camillea tinctor]|nr:hypothetical protein F4810DRAFT_518844 [Camillea tinctor]
MVWITAAVATLLATRAHASPDGVMEGMLGSAGMLEARQSPDSGLNMTAWNIDTMAACTSALSQLTTASNPSGMAICYNIPSLDTNAGTFMADLRMFQVSTPSGDFQGIAPQDISGGVQYNGATASQVSQTVNTRDTNDGLTKRQSVSPTLLNTYMIVGQINPDKMVQPMTLGVIEPLIMPIVTLSAKNAAGQTISTNVSSNEAAFVNGVFSNEVVMSDFALASLAVAEATQEMRNGTIAFIVPGVNILIFPVGLVVTCVWTLLGFAAYGFGTYERYGHRESYRRRTARLTAKPYSARI